MLYTNIFLSIMSDETAIAILLPFPFRSLRLYKLPIRLNALSHRSQTTHTQQQTFNGDYNAQHLNVRTAALHRLYPIREIHLPFARSDNGSVIEGLIVDDRC